MSPVVVWSERTRLAHQHAVGPVEQLWEYVDLTDDRPRVDAEDEAELGLVHVADADRGALVCFVTAVHEFDRLARVLVKAPAVVRDSNGSPTANPLGRALRQASGEVSRWASHFGLTPAERGRISRADAAPGRVEETDDLAGAYYR